MIAAGYTTVLYCDSDICKNTTYTGGGSWRGFGEYVGQTWAQTAKDARADGWRISCDRTRAYCPACENARKGIRP